MDGYLKIKTKLDNKDVDKGIVELENKIKKLEVNNSSLSTEQKKLQETINKYNELTQKVEEYKKQMASLQYIDSNGVVQVKDESKMLNLQAMYSIANQELEKQQSKIDKVYTKLNKVKSKQTENNAKISEFKQKIEQININKVQKEIDGVGKGIQNSIGKLGKMAMGVVGISTAFNAVKQAMNAVSQYNPQISADFEYMRYCIANLLTPAIQGLVKLLYTVLSYVNAIMSAWFGINLFSNSSVENFQKMQKSTSGTAKSAKEIQKSLQGFDEMNIVQDNSSNASSGSSGTGISTPSMDLSNIQGEVPKWLQWIIDNKELILGTLGAIAGIIVGMKIANLVNDVLNLTGGISKLVGHLGILKSIGIVVVIAAVVALIEDIIKMINDPCWHTFGEILTDIGIIVGVIALMMGGWVVAIVALVVAIAGLCIQLFTEQGAILSVEDAQKNLEEATKELEEANYSYINSVDKAENTLNKLKEAEEKAGITGEELNKQVEQGILDYRDMTDEQKAVYKAYLDNEKAQKELKEATDKLAEAKQKEKIASWENKLATMAEAGQYDEYKKAVVEAFENGELSADEARDLIGKSMSEMSRDSQQTFMEDLPSDIKNGLDPKNYETTGQKITKWFSQTWNKIIEDTRESIRTIANAVIGNLESMANNVIAAVNFIIKCLNKINFTVPDYIPGIGGKSFGLNIGLVPKVSLPRLAKGGVISQPTQAIIGEAGKEAVVPLENNLEWLDILATKIANKIGNGDAPFVLNIDSRVVQRGIARRQQELAFAKNGR